MSSKRSLSVFLRWVLVAVPMSGWVSGQLLVTEVNSNGTPGDFWELTNTGASAVDLSGWVWTDSAADPAGVDAFVVPLGTSLAAGESLIFVSDGVNEADFRAAWGLAAGVRILVGGPSLGQDDRVELYSGVSATTPVVSLNYAAGGFSLMSGGTSLGGHTGVSAGGQESTASLIWDPNSGNVQPKYRVANGVVFQTYVTEYPQQATGSPGKVGQAGVNQAPAFTPIWTQGSTTYWTRTKQLSGSPFRAAATDPEGQAITYSIVSNPSSVPLILSGGLYKFGSSTSLAAGDYPFTIRATDSLGAFAEKTFTLTILPNTGRQVILNEYNGVADDSQFPGPLGDLRFGIIPGNGGNWVELVVTGNGSPNQTTDLRGWKIDLVSEGRVKTLVLSQDPYWASVINGTILTFIDEDSAGGGMDTEIHATSNKNNGSGYLWSNVWVRDPIFIDQAASNLRGGWETDSSNTQVIIRDAAGSIHFGPAGEGIAAKDESTPAGPDTLIGVSSSECLRLEANPTTTVDPLFSLYEDGDDSTFGQPNRWSTQAVVQSFSSFRSGTATPPRFTSKPGLWARGSYHYAVTATDANGGTLTITASGLPSFLTLSAGANGTATLASNRALSLADAGEYVIRLQVSDGVLVTPQAFVLVVENPAPVVVVNEFNAVSSSQYLNGGTQAVDLDGGAASDTHFGRVRGNGGDWLELVVVGDGGPGTVDLRGWKIEIGQRPGGAFEKRSTLVLSSHADWAAVPAGTILTFSERNTAQGGLDTQMAKRDRSTTVGDRWSHVWMGDGARLVYTDEATNGYVVEGGTVSGIGIDESSPCVQIRDAAGSLVFGPAGEGAAPLSGLSNIEIFELEADPRPTVSAAVASTELVAGYGTGSSGSTFGWPNEATRGGEVRVQDFSVFVSSDLLEEWADGYDLAGASALPGADPDGDGRDNLTEYAFGGSPAVKDGGLPLGQIVGSGENFVWSHPERVGDSRLVVSYEVSEDLVQWEAVVPLSRSVAPLSGATGYQTVTVILPRPEGGKWFVRAVALR